MLKRLLPPSIRDLKRKALRVQTAFVPHAVVLLYHRIAEGRADPFGLAVSPANFAEQLDLLSRWGDCLPVEQLPDHLESGRRRTAFVISFDDGYGDNADVAAPLLRARGLPATLFVISGILGDRKDFWWDALARAILEAERLPARLELKVGDFRFIHDLASAATLSPEEQTQVRGWRIEERPPSHPREILYHSLWRAIDAAPAAQREPICSAVLSWAGLAREVPAADRPLDEERVHALASEGLIEIGGHTMSHLPLDTLERGAALVEIEGCRARLTEVAGCEIRSFSYPFGRFRRETAELVRAAGFHQACDSRHDIAFRGANHYHLPRFVAPDIDGDGLASLLHGLVHA